MTDPVNHATDAEIAEIEKAISGDRFYQTIRPRTVEALLARLLELRQVAEAAREAQTFLDRLYPYLERVNHLHLPGGSILYVGELWDVQKRLAEALEGKLYERRLAALEEAAREVTIGGNHLACVLIGMVGANHPRHSESIESVSKILSGDKLDLWIAWRSIMRLAEALEVPHE